MSDAPPKPERRTVHLLFLGVRGRNDDTGEKLHAYVDLPHYPKLDEGDHLPTKSQPTAPMFVASGTDAARA